ncbi:hypothetical protein [Mesorhizobium sp. AA22]|uniref:hypothetical protein n=1 Tax=Mesorhizobium sp. AA22 TaxID=1854057 RepID=UPI0007EC7935|nr:hypothetical protein [Mesorhizobium sp. AA22]QIA24995.1 hypothetical protein A9K68_026690 [Mesorhizobium sp. AA22]
MNKLIAAAAASILIVTAAHAGQETTVSAGATYNTDSKKLDWNASASQSNTTSSERGSSTTKVEVSTTNGTSFGGQATQTTTRK